MIWWTLGAVTAAAVLWGWWAWRQVPEDPFDMGYPDSYPPVDSDFECPDTEPTSPGALDSDLARLS